MKSEEVMKSIEAEAPKRGLPIIGPRRGVYLDEVVQAHNPSTILEVGTLVGYSAIRMGRLLAPGGKITCVEVNPDIAKAAAVNIRKAGLAGRIEIKIGDAKEVLPTLKGSFDMVFLDAIKEDYLTYLKSCERLLHSGSVVVADNVKKFANEMPDYLDYVRNSGMYRSNYREAPSNYGTDEADAIEVSVKV